ncbi:MAG: hypothetical protein ACE14T_04790 [Syntrophales bacterium]
MLDTHPVQKKNWVRPVIKKQRKLFSKLSAGTSPAADLKQAELDRISQKTAALSKDPYFNPNQNLY